MQTVTKLELIAGLARLFQEVQSEDLYADTQSPEDVAQAAKLLFGQIQEIANLDGRPSVVVVDYTPTFNEVRIAFGAGKITGIKAYRERTGLGLKDSKDAIDDAMERMQIAFNLHDQRERRREYAPINSDLIDGDAENF